MADDDGFGMYTTMSIASLGPATFPSPKRYTRSRNLPEFLNPTTNDKARTLLQKPDLLMDISDIPGTRSKILHHPRQGYAPEIFVGYNARSDIICPNNMLKTRRHIDPLAPEYPLPTYEPAQPVIPKFVRDSFKVDDIDGAKPRRSKPIAERNTLYIDDIEGARAMQKLPRRCFDIFLVVCRAHDLCRADPRNLDQRSQAEVKSKFAISRQTNPLDPEYFINGMRVSGTFRPKPLKKHIPENKFLQTRDINYPPIDYGDSHRREFRNTNFIGDIEGARADTIKNGLVSKRNTNPLNPIYTALDPGEVLENPVESGIPPQILFDPTFKPTRNESTLHINHTFGDSNRTRSINRDEYSATSTLNLRPSDPNPSLELTSGSQVIDPAKKGGVALATSRSLSRDSRQYESDIQSVRDLP